MFLRIAALLALVCILAGGAWYFFRDTRQKQVDRWRTEYELLKDSGGPTERDYAERLVDQILQLQPKSTYDRMAKAKLNERKGSEAGFQTALEIYDEIARGGSGAQRYAASLHRAILLRNLGRIRESDQACLTVLDVYPLAATIIMAETAVAEFDMRRALTLYTQALDRFAKDAEARAQTRQGIAEVLLRMVEITDERKSLESLDDETRTQVEQEENTRTGVLQIAAEQLRTAIGEITRARPDSSDTAKRHCLWLAQLYTRLGDAVRGQEESPATQAADAIRARIDKQPEFALSRAKDVTVELGGLILRSIDEFTRDRSETRAATLAEKAELVFFEGLGGKTLEEEPDLAAGPFYVEVNRKDTDDAVEIREDPEIERRREYVRLLARVVRLHIDNGRADAVLKGDSKLQLARRVEAAASSGDEGVAGLFSLLRGFAYCRVRDMENARRTFDAHLAATPEEAIDIATIQLATECWKIAPDSPLALEFVERLVAREKLPVRLLGGGLSVALKARRHATHRERGSKLVDELLSKVESSAHQIDERLDVSRFIAAVRGPAESLNYLRNLQREHGDVGVVANAFTQALFAAAEQRLNQQDTPGAAELYREAFAAQLVLFVENPARDTSTRSTLNDLARSFVALQQDPRVAEMLSTGPLEVPKEQRETLAEGVRAFLVDDFESALSRLSEVPRTTPLSPFVSYLRGQCHLEAAERMLRDARQQGRDLEDVAKIPEYDALLRRAESEFSLHASYVPNQIELLNIQLRNLKRGEDVSESLFQEIEALSKKSNVDYLGNWLFARCLYERLRARYHDEALKNSEIERLQVKLQFALRDVIARKPTFTPAYLELARTYTFGELDLESPVKRQLFRIEFDRAVAVLEGCPVQDENVLFALIGYLHRLAREDLASGERARAKLRYQRVNRELELLALIQPSADRMKDLLVSYYDAEDVASALKILSQDDRAVRVETLSEDERKAHDRLDLLLDERERVAGQRLGQINGLVRYLQDSRTGEQNLYNALLLAIRERFERLPAAAGVRHMHLGQIDLTRLQTAATDFERRGLRKSMLEHFSSAIEAYESAGEPPPFLVLNNLAWYLCESPDTVDRVRGLQLAEQAATRAESPSRYPDVFDTHAWALFQNGKLTEAEQVLRNLIGAVDSPSFRYRLAQVLFRQERFEDARLELDTALRSVDDFPEETKARQLQRDIESARRRLNAQTGIPRPASRVESET